MSIQAVLLPLFVEVLLTFVLLCWMGYQRQHALQTRATDWNKIALREPNWPPRTLQAANAFSNQFELPVLFYVLTILAIITRHADFLFVILAWLFVLFRIWHAYEHTTTNVVRRRGLIYAVAALVLMIMWIVFMIRIMLGLP